MREEQKEVDHGAAKKTSLILIQPNVGAELERRRKPRKLELR